MGFKHTIRNTTSVLLCFSATPVCYSVLKMFVLIALALLVSDSVPFVEAQPDHSVVSLPGENVTFSYSPDFTHVVCNGTQGHGIYWSKYKRAVETLLSRCLSLYGNNNNDRITVDYLDNKYELHISNVQQSDTGVYECRTSDGISTARITVQLNVREPLCWIEVGDNVSLVCYLQMYRALQWIAPNGTVIASRSEQSNQPLVLNFTAREEHNFQIFTCAAISDSGTYNPECEVTPLEYTFITISPQISRVKQGDNVMFNCDARLGLRRPHRYTYTWLQDENIVLQGLNTSLYIVRDIQLSDNGTRVQCKASNDGREEMESSEASIYVDSVTELRTTNPEDGIKTLSYVEKSTGIITNQIDVTGISTDPDITISPSITGIVGDKCETGASLFNAVTKSLLAACVILLLTSFSIIIGLVVCLVKSRKVNNNASNSPTGGSQMTSTYTDLQLRDVTKPEYETCLVKPADNNDTYAALDGEYEVPQTDNVGNSGDAGLYELPKV